MYRWTSSDEVFTYTKWLTHAPLTNESCRCVAVVSGIHSDCPSTQASCAGWTVEDCSLKRRVLCEVKKPCNCE